VQEAEQVIEYFHEDLDRVRYQVEWLEEQANQFREQRTDMTENKMGDIQRVPYKYTEDGLFFLRYDGNVTIKVIKHVLIYDAIDIFDQFSVYYESIDETIVFDKETIIKRNYHTMDNKLGYVLLYVDPGNYMLHIMVEKDGKQYHYEQELPPIYTMMYKSIQVKDEIIFYIFDDDLGVNENDLYT